MVKRCAIAVALVVGCGATTAGALPTPAPRVVVSSSIEGRARVLAQDRVVAECPVHDNGLPCVGLVPIGASSVVVEWIFAKRGDVTRATIALDGDEVLLTAALYAGWARVEVEHRPPPAVSFTSRNRSGEVHNGSATRLLGHADAGQLVAQVEWSRDGGVWEDVTNMECGFGIVPFDVPLGADAGVAVSSGSFPSDGVPGDYRFAVRLEEPDHSPRVSWSAVRGEEQHSFVLHARYR